MLYDQNTFSGYRDKQTIKNELRDRIHQALMSEHSPDEIYDECWNYLFGRCEELVGKINLTQLIKEVSNKFYGLSP